MARLVMPASTRAMRFCVVDLEHPVHLATTPTTTASSAGSAPPHSDVPAPRGHDLDAVLAADSAGPCDTSSRRARQHDRQRHTAIGGQRIGLERAPAVLVGDDGVGADQGDCRCRDDLARGARAPADPVLEARSTDMGFLLIAAPSKSRMPYARYSAGMQRLSRCTRPVLNIDQAPHLQRGCETSFV